MARMARVVVPNIPHHITQRGNRRQRVFFCEDDYRVYKELLQTHCARCDVQVWAYCLMPNHVHLILVPSDAQSLRRSVAEAHRRYTRYVNFRENWRGYLWQGRFASFPMDENYLLSAVRYVEMNPVRAGLCNTAAEWPWSSAQTHLTCQQDDLMPAQPMRKLVANWESYLDQQTCANDIDSFRQHSRTGRPLGAPQFIDKLERETGRRLRPRKAGRPPKVQVALDRGEN
ncbi:MAG: transposase [Pseudomonadota bacterium]